MCLDAEGIIVANGRYSDQRAAQSHCTPPHRFKRVYVCVCVCVCVVCVGVCVCACVYTCMHACMYEYVWYVFFLWGGQGKNERTLGGGG